MMFEEIRTTARRSSRKVVLSRASTLSLISLLVLVSSCLSGSLAQARTSQTLNRDQTERRSALREAYESMPHLQQGTEYDDTFYPETAFSQSDDYLKVTSFIVGFKLADTYKYTDECINDIVSVIDDTTYFGNNVTLHEKAVEKGEKSTPFEPFLNMTGIIGGPVADALPTCFLFATDFYKVEQSRFLTFNSNWGNFFLAFLFNQMGNALNFQTKFERIQVEKERQNYPGVWQEYGDLVYLIWTFQPIEEASLVSVENAIEKWMADHEWLLDADLFGGVNDMQKALVKTGVSGLSRFVHSAGNEFGFILQAFRNVFAQTLEAGR
jgi:hypothetical protein